MASPAGNKLAQSPTNLKEAIDWILRVTNKDGQQGGQDAENHCWCDLANGVTDLLEGVEHHLTEEETKIVKNIIDVIYDVGGTKYVKALIEKVADQLKDFIGWDPSGKLVNKKGIGVNENHRTNGNKKYVSHYSEKDKFGDEMAGDDDDDDSNDNVRQAKLRCAKILLGCIPFIFSGLSYMAWMAYALNGFRSDGGKSEPLKHYVMRMGYKWEEWRCKSGQEVNLRDLIKVFENCKVFEGVEVKGNYATYLFKLRTKASSDAAETAKKIEENNKKDDELKRLYEQNALIKLNILCAGYFRSLHRPQDLHSRNPRTPNTIREILYWLTSLPYCPIYRTLVPKVQEMIRRIGSRNGGSGGGATDGSVVTFYGSNVDGNEKALTVTPANVASYLLGAALVAPMVLLSIQDTIESRVGKVERTTGGSVGHKSYKTQSTGDVPIHDLYANMQFYFSYPLSETQSYYLLQDCLVALYYQLYFLKYVTFSDYTGGFAWGYCKYGDKVKCDNISGWMCPGGGQSGKDKCGTSKESPLQAFLTDCLKGFTCPVVMEKMKEYQENLRQLRENSGTDNNSVYNGAYPGFLDHRNHLPVGQECAVPMGFSGSFRSGGAPAPGKDMIGLGINAVLKYYTNDDVHSSVLYQITRCICSLTRRVPRSTGTLFGFFHGLGHVLFHRQIMKNGRKENDPTVKNALTSEMLRCPGSSNSEELLQAIKEWRGGSHTDNKCLTLDSIQNCDGKGQSGQTCGKYFQPITGSLYNSMATQFCETYVSWIVHLSWRLHDGLESLLKEFVKIDCQKSGCSTKTGSHCCQGGKDHGKDCQCANVVQCAGVHPLFYRFGFTYRGPDYLMYTGGSGNNNYKRNCKQFTTQLKSVLTEGPFTKVIQEIRKFIYTTRALFGLYIGVYWLAVIVYLLWSITGPLDLMHIQSDWRSPRSYLVPLQRILADGSRKGFCAVGYFQDSGDRLLSEGISDVYL